MIEINLADKHVVHYLMKRFGVRTKHKLGQNFLIRPDVVKEIARVSELNENSFVMEIGSGIGTLTQALAQTGANVISFEVDKSLENILKHTLEPYNNVRVIFEDVLKADLKNILGEKDWHVAANLPYYITTPILLYLIQSNLPISIFVFMMQKEVAERIMASPGTKAYGALSIAVQFYCEVEHVMDIPPSAFIPKPAVTSTILKMKKRSKPSVNVENEKLFFRLVKLGFGQRRKVFTNALKSGGLSKEMINQILMKADIDGTRRGETFSMEEYARLANVWNSFIKKKA